MFGWLSFHLARTDGRIWIKLGIVVLVSYSNDCHFNNNYQADPAAAATCTASH